MHLQETRVAGSSRRGLLRFLALMSLGCGLSLQCSDASPETPATGTTASSGIQQSPTQDAAGEEQGKGKQAGVPELTARDLADRHLAWISGKDLVSLDRAFFRFTLEKPGQPDKPARVVAQGSAWLSREGKARIALRRGEDAVQLSFVSRDGVQRGPAEGPFAPAEERESQRMQELTLALETLLGWDLLVPKVRLTLLDRQALRSESPGPDAPSKRIVERGWKGGKDLGNTLASLKIDGRSFALEGRRAGLSGSLPERIRLPLTDLSLHLETWLTQAEFAPGHLDPGSVVKQRSALVMGQEEENHKPTLREYAKTWEVALDDPGDWEGRFRILTKEIPQPFLDAGLRPSGLPTLTDNGKMLIHVRPADEKVARPKAPKGYRLQARGRRVSAVVYADCTWAEAPQKLRRRLEPYIEKLGLRARGPLWMSPYLDWSSLEKAPGSDKKIKIRGEIRVQ